MSAPCAPPGAKRFNFFFGYININTTTHQANHEHDGNKVSVIIIDCVVPRNISMPKLTKVIKEKYEAKLDFPGGWGFKPKNLLWGVYEYFLEVHIATLPTGCMLITASS